MTGGKLRVIGYGAAGRNTWTGCVKNGSRESQKRTRESGGNESSRGSDHRPRASRQETAAPAAAREAPAPAPPSATALPGGPKVSRTLTTDLFEQIRSDILHNRLEPGSRLLFRDIRERYKSGLSPLREALMRLVSEGLVLLEDHKGFRVAPVSREEMIDIANTLLELEAIAIRMAIEKGNDHWEAQIVARYHELSKREMFAPTARSIPNGRPATSRFTRRCTRRADRRRSSWSASALRAPLALSPAADPKGRPDAERLEGTRGADARDDRPRHRNGDRAPAQTPVGHAGGRRHDGRPGKRRPACMFRTNSRLSKYPAAVIQLPANNDLV